MSFNKYILQVLIFNILLSVNCMAGTSIDGEINFPEVEGFSKSGNIASYKPETLFEYINGAAELYLMYDFTGLTLQVYEDKEGKTITAEIYDQQNVNNSFGIYSQERPYECEFLPIGTQANYMEGYLNFYQGRYYVKISGYNLGSRDKEYLTSTGKRLSSQLGETAFPPKMLKTFPEISKIVNSEEYIARDFLGYSFFEKVFTAEYESAGTNYKLFIIKEPDRASLEKSINAYKKQISSSADILKGGIHKLDDPYQGEIIISVSENYIVGAVNPDNGKIDTEIIKKTISNLK